MTDPAQLLLFPEHGNPRCIFPGGCWRCNNEAESRVDHAPGCRSARIIEETKTQTPAEAGKESK